jgi:hypothetical protein
MNAPIKFLLAAALLLPAFKASAGQTPAADLSIDESSLMIEEAATIPSPAWQRPAWDPAADPVGTIKKIMNMAFKVIDIIQKNHPVVNITTDYANAVPEGVTNWTQLTGWQGPASKTYTFSAKNAAGIRVVKATYNVLYLWGGGYKGKGKFLTGVTIEPVSVETAWACDLDLTVDVPDAAVTNVGTETDPVSSMELHLNWKVKTFTQNIAKEAVYRVQGDGLLEERGPLFKKGIEARTEAKINSLTESLKTVKFD